MAQFARPTADTDNTGAFVDEGGASTGLFQSIDESVRSDTDYIESPQAPANAVYVTALGAVTDPASSSGHVVRYAYQKNSSGGNQVDLTVELRQGYVSEASQGTLIASNVHTNIPNGWTAGSFTLTSGEADSITDYSDLYIRIVANQP